MKDAVIDRKYFAFSLHKSGSTLFNNLLYYTAFHSKRLQLENAIQFISYPDELFKLEHSEAILEDIDFLNKSTYSFQLKNTIYGGFRFVPAFFKDGQVGYDGLLCLVRDPRDVLTSFYYSIKKSHRIPKGNAGKQMQNMREESELLSIDEYVLNQAIYGKWKMRYLDILKLKDISIFWRYEDVIFKKLQWFAEMLKYLQIEFPPNLQTAIINHVDILPDKEDEAQHIRQVHPGDHRRKLKKETIIKLNEVFEEVLFALNYAF